MREDEAGRVCMSADSCRAWSGANIDVQGEKKGPRHLPEAFFIMQVLNRSQAALGAEPWRPGAMGHW